MNLIARVEEGLLVAYRAARTDGLWETVTFVTPSRLASLQWRRRLARRAEGVFNVRFVDLPQLSAELMARRGTPVRRVSAAAALAAAWQCLQGAGGRFRPLAAHAAIPSQVLRAFETLESLSDEERARVSPDFAELAAALRERLGSQRTATGALRDALEGLGPDDFQGRLIVIEAETGNRLTTDLAAKVLGRARSIQLDGQDGLEVDIAEVHDEQDEVSLAMCLIQDWAVNEGICPSEVAVVVPAADPYVKLFSLLAPLTEMGWNGMAARTVRETASGRRLAATPLDLEYWPAAIEAWTPLEGDEGQIIRDELEAWKGIEALAPSPNPVLLEALREHILSLPTPEPKRLGTASSSGRPPRRWDWPFDG